MRKFTVQLLIISLFLSQSGCATIVSGKTQDVMIRSNPPGATVYINEMPQGVTPMVANLIRKKRHLIRITKDGHSEVTQATTRGFNWWYIGNLIFGGLIGIIVDPITGAIFEIEPGDINKNLPPAGSAAPAATSAAIQEITSSPEVAAPEPAPEPAAEPTVTPAGDIVVVVNPGASSDKAMAGAAQ